MEEETIRVTETIDDHINTNSTDFKTELIEVASMVVKEEVSIIEVAIMCLFRDVVETIGKEAAKEDLATTYTPTASTTWTTSSKIFRQLAYVPAQGVDLSRPGSRTTKQSIKIETDY